MIAGWRRRWVTLPLDANATNSWNFERGTQPKGVTEALSLKPDTSAFGFQTALGFE